MNKIEIKLLKLKLKYNQIKAKATADELKNIKATTKQIKGLADYNAKIDDASGTTATATKSSKLSISSELCELVKGVASAILNDATATKVQSASNNKVRKALALAVVKNSKERYKVTHKSDAEKLHANGVCVAGWSTLLLCYFEIVTEFRTATICEKVDGTTTILTASELKAKIDAITKANEKAKADREQARKNAKAKATADAKAKAEKVKK